MLCVVLLLWPGVVLSQSELAGAALATGPRIDALPHAAGAVVIDGVLDDAIWRQALVIPLTVETHPSENTPAKVRTDAYLVEDGERLLVAFDAHDPDPGEIRAYLRDRDSAYSDDMVGVVLDSFDDQRRAFEFFVNALGVQMDLTIDEINGGESDAWDAIWDSAGRIDERGYVVEMAIPFSQLSFKRVAGPQTWGIDLLRFYPRNDRVRLSNNAQERGTNCYLCQFDKVRGFERAEPGRNLEIVPTLTASQTDARADLPDGPLVAGDTETEVGLGVRWGVTPDITASLALNPDFSQVEADVPQLDVNNQFALFFPESRPFFLEDANYFSTPINAVFTRTIADPDVSAKLTGRSGENTFGVFGAEDAVTNLLFPGPLGSSSESLEQSSRALVGRYSRGFGDASTVGALVTSRSGSGYSNVVAGFDGRYRINDSNNFRFQFLQSETEYPEQVVADFDQPDGAFTGDALRVNYNFNTRNWFANVNYLQLDPSFRADSGFVSRVDVEQRNLNAGHVWHGGDDAWWNQLRVGARSNVARDRKGRLLQRNTESFFNMQGPLQSFVQVGAWTGRQFWDGTLYDAGGAVMFAQLRPTRGLQVSLQANRSEQIDFANSRLGDQASFEPGIEWNANRHLLVRLRQTFRQLDTKAGERIFEAALTDLRLTWQFNLRSFLRLTLQRQSIDRNPSVHLDPVDETSVNVATQLLYSYKLNPQTVIFAGYSENRIENDPVPSLTLQDRTFFVKLGYAWAP